MSPEEEEPEVTCPVCGNPVSLDDEFCPHCGAEFEEEEIEEIVEVEETPEDEYATEEFEEYEAEEPLERHSEETEYEDPAIEAKPRAASASPSTGIFDLRVIGIALLILGIIGAQIALFIDWYWEWVPAIDSNLGMFSLIGIAVIVVGFLGFAMVKKSVSEGKKMSPLMPSILLGIFLFGIIALIMILANGPINDAMGSANLGIAGVFIVLLIVGVFMFMTGQKKSMPAC